MVRKAVLILAALASPASAQTTCQWIGSVWTCSAPQNSGINIDWGNQQLPNIPNAFYQGFQQGEAMRRAREEDQRRRQQITDDAAAANIRSMVTAMLGRGQCKEAIDLALTSGDLALATQAKGFCSTPSPAH